MVVSQIVAVCRLRILWRWRRKLKLELFTCSRSNIRIINVLEVKLNGGDGIMGWYPVDNRSPLNTEDWVPKLKVECCFSDDLDRWSKGAYSIIFRLITLKRHLVVFFATFFVLTWKLVSFACFFSYAVHVKGFSAAPWIVVFFQKGLHLQTRRLWTGCMCHAWSGKAYCGWVTRSGDDLKSSDK